MAYLQSILAISTLLLALLVNIASATDYGYGPTPKIEKSKPVRDYKLHLTKPDYDVSKPEGNDELQLPTIISVQGMVLCKSGSNYFPIQGN